MGPRIIALFFTVIMSPGWIPKQPKRCLIPHPPEMLTTFVFLFSPIVSKVIIISFYFISLCFFFIIFYFYYCYFPISLFSVSYTHLRAHETRHDLVCRLLLEKKKKQP